MARHMTQMANAVSMHFSLCVFYVTFIHGVLALSKTYTFVYEFCLA